MKEFYKNLVKLGFTISDNKVYFKNHNVIILNDLNTLWISKYLSSDMLLNNLVPLVEKSCVSTTVGNFSIGNSFPLENGKVIISEMHYSKLLADTTGYYIQSNKEDLNDGLVFAMCSILRSVPWSVVEGLLEGGYK